MPSGPIRSASTVEPTRSQNNTVTCLRSPSTEIGTSGFARSTRRADDGDVGSTDPHAPHVAVVVELSVLQRGQRMPFARCETRRLAVNLTYRDRTVKHSPAPRAIAFRAKEFEGGAC